MIPTINRPYFTKYSLLAEFFLIEANCFLCGTNLSHIYIMLTLTPKDTVPRLMPLVTGKSPRRLCFDPRRIYIEICGGKIRTGTGISPSTSVFPCHRNSIKIHTHHHHHHHHLQASVTRRTKARSLRTIKTQFSTKIPGSMRQRQRERERETYTALFCLKMSNPTSCGFMFL